MKIRNGFVSNSSSSSFLCDLSGNMESGMDLGLLDAGMFQCVNGHTLMDSYKLEEKELSVEDYKNWLKTYVKNNSWARISEEDLSLEEDEFMEYFEEEWMDTFNDEGLDSSMCPICQFEDTSYEIIAKWYLKNQNITRKQMAKKLKEEFQNYEGLEEYIKDVKYENS